MSLIAGLESWEKRLFGLRLKRETERSASIKNQCRNRTRASRRFLDLSNGLYGKPEGLRVAHR